MNKPKNQGKVFIDTYPILHYTKCIFEYYLGIELIPHSKCK